jgi:hypothetical protein
MEHSTKLNLFREVDAQDVKIMAVNNPSLKIHFLPVSKVFFFVVMREISSFAVAFFVTPRTSSNAFRCC